MSKACCCLTALLLTLACTVDDRSVGANRPEPEMASATSEASDMPSLDGLGGAGGTAALPAGGSSGVSPASETSCGQTREAVRSPVDLLLQLDSSASMLEALPMAGATGAVATKWDAVRLALGNFVQDAANADVGFGVSYFPQVIEDVPYSCTTNADCLSAGPCSNSSCVQSLAETPADGSPAVTFIASTSGQTCATDTECASGESCRTTSGTCLFPGAGAPALSALPVCESNADCAGIPGTTCEEIGTCQSSALQLCTASVPCPAGTGACVPFPYSCLGQTRCEVADYTTPAVSISAALLGGSAIVSSLASRTPQGLTPTAPALSGALAHAALWAQQHPERRVATVLATDGFPTVCEPADIAQIATLAAAGVNDVQSVQTFVIGIFGSNDLASGGQASLDQLAAAGGTGQAWVADTSGDVARSFENSLRAIRANAASCGLALDPAAAQQPDAVEIELIESGDVPRALARGDGPDDCASGRGGWFYVRDAIGLPARIELCPAVCPAPGSATRVQLRTGCEE